MMRPNSKGALLTHIKPSCLSNISSLGRRQRRPASAFITRCCPSADVMIFSEALIIESADSRLAWDSVKAIGEACAGC